MENYDYKKVWNKIWNPDPIELFSVIHNIKPSLRALVSKDELEFIQPIIKEYGLEVYIEKIKNSGLIVGDWKGIWIGISYSKDIAENLIKNRNKVEIEGEYLGYPNCCIESFKRRGVAEIKDIYFSSNKHSFYTNNVFNFSTRLKKDDEKLFDNYIKRNWDAKINPMMYHLISHIPCSYECKESIKIGKNILKEMIKFDPETATSIERSLKSTILFFDKFEFVVLNPIEITSEYIKYDSVLPPFGLVDETFFKKILEGNKVIISKDNLAILKDDEEIFKLHEKIPSVLVFK